MMPAPLAAIAATLRSRADAIRWACVLEATAPKAGNVHPARSFRDLQYHDFVIAAHCTAERLDQSQVPIAERMRSAVIQTRAESGTNVNLGIVLLLGPLVAADEQACDSSAFDGRRRLAPDRWRSQVQRILQAFTEADGGIVYDTIRSAGAGGLSTADADDVYHTTGPVDLLGAMRSAVERDRIALQYATGYQDLFESVVPIVASSLVGVGDLLGGIADAHLRLLAERGDSLIARKCGREASDDVMRRAAIALGPTANARGEFDAFLRSQDHRLNPGTTADLIAAALYVLLRAA